MTDMWKNKKLMTKEYVKKKYHTQRLYLEEEPEIPDALPAVQNKVIGLYFSASWCPPCQVFTPVLVKLYEELKKRGSCFEVVFVSFDKTEEDMISYFMEKHGDWLAVPFDADLINELRDMYDIKAVPKLVVVKDNGELITMKGRKDIQDKGVVCFRNWLESADLNDSQDKNGDTNSNHNGNNNKHSTDKKESENEVKLIQPVQSEEKIENDKVLKEENSDIITNGMNGHSGN